MTPLEMQDFFFKYEATVSYEHTGDGQRLVSVRLPGTKGPSVARTLRDAALAAQGTAQNLRLRARE